MFDALLEAIKNNCIDEVKRMLNDESIELETLLNTTDASKNTLLHIAVTYGHYRIIKHLIAKGADVSLKNQEGNTPLHIAVKKGYFNVVDEFVGISSSAKNREKKRTWSDKDRNEKLNKINASQKKARQTLQTTNNLDETPLMLAATLDEDRIYKKLLAVNDVGYTKQHLEQVRSLRQQHLESTKRKSLFAALIETFCPSASLAELMESFAYSGLTIGASAAALMGINIVFSGLAILGLGLMTYANYKKIQAERGAVGELVELQLQSAYLSNIKTRLKKLEQQTSLSIEDREELNAMQQELNQVIEKPRLIQGHETSAADYVTRQDKMNVLLSSLASFLCAYAGLLGVLGLGLSIATGVAGTTTAALLATGPLGVGIALGVGIVIAAGLAVYHYSKRKEDYLVYGEIRQAIHKEKEMIYQYKQDLLNTSTINTINHLLEPELEQPNVLATLQQTATHEDKKTFRVVKSDVQTPERQARHNHGHRSDELCEKEIQALALLRRGNTTPTHSDTIKLEPRPKKKPIT